MGALRTATSLGGATQASVWVVHPQQGRAVVVKSAHDPASFGLEVHAYRTWGKALSGLVPELVAVLAAHHTLVLEWIEGEPAASVEPETLLSLHRQAGTFCRRLASCAHEDVDPMGLPEALALRMRGWCRRGARHLSSATLDAAASRFDPTAFEGATRVPAHRDLAPHNWIVVDGPEPCLRVVDFGHARADAPLTDLVKLWDAPWEATPGARAAFFEGYGRPLTHDETHQLRQLALLHGVATAVWGHEHGEPEFFALGGRILRRLLD